MAQKMVRDFAQKEIAPVIKEYDRKQERFLCSQAHGRAGILGICFRRVTAGGLDYISWGLACEELEAVDTSLRVRHVCAYGFGSMSIFQGN